MKDDKRNAIQDTRREVTGTIRYCDKKNSKSLTIYSSILINDYLYSD